MESKLNFNFKTTQAIVQKIAFIESFKGKWSGLELSESQYLRELKRIATIESIGSSTRIEGSTLTDDEVKELLDAIKISSFKSREEQEVIGYYDALNLILESYNEITITENNVHHLHKVLLKESTKDESHRGQYKQLSNKVVASYPNGVQKVIFNTTEPFFVPREMDNLYEWVNHSFDVKELHPLVTIATFIYEFLSIHPYQDGNGRLSRLLTTLLLLQNGYDFMQYASMEIEIEKRKKDYYKALMDAQQHRGKPEEIINQWMLFFLDTLQATIETLEVRYAQIKDKKSYLNDRQQEVLGFVTVNEPVKISDIISALPIYTSYILKKDVKYLVDENLIKKVGKGRATVYLREMGRE